jgi:hypothetical protein
MCVTSLLLLKYKTTQSCGVSTNRSFENTDASLLRLWISWVMDRRVCYRLKPVYMEPVLSGHLILSGKFSDSENISER